MKCYAVFLKQVVKDRRH